MDRIQAKLLGKNVLGNKAAEDSGGRTAPEEGYRERVRATGSKLRASSSPIAPGDILARATGMDPAAPPTAAPTTPMASTILPVTATTARVVVTCPLALIAAAGPSTVAALTVAALTAETVVIAWSPLDTIDMPKAGSKAMPPVARTAVPCSDHHFDEFREKR
ncbi:hypothetical protein K458DRAFT_400552 [Lentithecium fluviatile CBS 122367]|uniref:Uncharacterized protein n=1 Tax=Lentithecium fluviatile CBS 122367 TaxID=1168545 RepID=A0A6G1JCQ2_9PLEO|nr:hypothetical protein K458DRAFT_400552 [Lentithecium fluviatile CBS 122367]